jgi:hypothetical protein
MPSGHVPSDTFDHPQKFGGLDCHIPVPQAAIDDLHKMITEEAGLRDAHLLWYSAEFAELAEDIYMQIGKPTLSLQTAWDIFQKMSQPIADVLEL